MKIEVILDEYREHMDIKGYSPKTIKGYLRYVKEILEYLKNKKNIKRLQDVTHEEVRCYQSEIYARKRSDGKPLSARSRCYHINAVKHFFKYLFRKGFILYNPASDIEIPKIQKYKLREVLTSREIKKLLECVKGKTPINKRDRAILEVLYSTGIRNQELRNLELRDIDLDRRELRVRKGKGFFGAKERVVPLGKAASAYLEEYIFTVRPRLSKCWQNDYVFISKSSRKLAGDMLSKIVKRWAKKAGIKRRVYPHMLRHTFATHFLRGGADIRYVQEMLGHSSLDSTTVYTRVEISDLKKVHAKSHPREKIW